MIISSIVLKNRILASKMKILSSEIDRLVDLWNIIRNPGKEYNYLLARQIKNKIDESRNAFNDITLIYESQANRKKKTFKNIDYFHMIEKASKEIENTFLSLKFDESR